MNEKITASPNSEDIMPSIEDYENTVACMILQKDMDLLFRGQPIDKKVRSTMQELYIVSNCDC